MNNREIFKELLKHRKLANKRSLAYGSEQKAKLFMYIIGGIIAFYLLFASIMFAMLVNDDRHLHPAAFLLAGAPLIFAIDFMMRFISQQTPSQLIKPYLILPIPRYLCIDTFIYRSIFNLENFSWMIMLVPYAIMSIVFRNGIFTALAFLLAYQLIIYTCSQFYLICRSFLKDSIAYIVLPIVFVALMALPGIVPELSIEHFFKFYYAFGDGLMNGNLLYWAILVALLCLSIFVNRKVQYNHVMAEASRLTTTKINHLSSFSFFDKLGEIGEYMKLEMKLILRNKQPRSSLILIWSCVIIMWLSYSIFMQNAADIYGNTGNFFWCFYCFAFPGIITLQRLMAYEGNYIDCLMVHHENLLKLFTAKYYFYTIVLILPFIMGIISVIAGESWTLLMVIACLLYTAGPIMCMTFFLCLFNKNTMPLDASFAHHTGADMKWLPNVLMMGAIGLPVLICWILTSLLSGNISYIVISVLSVPFILCHRIWLRYIYRRFMAIRYENMEGLRSSR